MQIIAYGPQAIQFSRQPDNLINRLLPQIKIGCAQTQIRRKMNSIRQIVLFCHLEKSRDVHRMLKQ